MNRKTIVLFLSAVFFLAFGCKNANRQDSGENGADNSESLVEINKILVKKDADKIRAYIKRRDWNMTETRTGLWYSVYEKGKGKPARKGMIATISYSVDLLDGTRCYDSDSLGYKKFKIGEGGVESGLEEGILLLHEGDRARFIMPPHLAHGLIGDENCIPARAIIIYNVNLLKLEDQ